jgi:hypothetical protein
MIDGGACLFVKTEGSELRMIQLIYILRLIYANAEVSISA